MAGHIDKSDADRFARWAGQVKVGESYVDRDAAALFFFEPVGVGAGQGADQGALAVIDVAGRSDNDRLHSDKFT